MSNLKKNQRATERRALRVRHKLRMSSSLPRVSVFRSLNQIYAQLIDDTVGNTLVSCSSLDMDKAQIGNKRAVAKVVGVELAQRAIAKGINAACFDRGSYRYHGRVKELCDGLREGGLKI